MGSEGLNLCKPVERVRTYTVDNFPFDYVAKIKRQKRQKGNPGGTKGYYKDIITAFDIETSNITLNDQPHAIMYIWQWAIGDDKIVFGRTWEEFKIFAERLSACCKEKEKILVLVHNLSFEFQFLAGIYNFQPEDVMATHPRRILKCMMYGSLEFRCSYLHSNMSLKKYLENMHARHQKLDGDSFDYSIVRYPWTELSARELEYCRNDVIGLVEAAQYQMAKDGDTIYSFPLTSTGYVRRDCKKAMRPHRNYVFDLLPDMHLYEMLREAFRGGNTHANRYYSNLDFDLKDVKSADRSSSYPDVQVNCSYPISSFHFLEDPDLDKITDLIKRDKAIIMRVAFNNIRLKNKYWGFPYIPIDKSRNLINFINDNGRVLSADYLEITITDVDYEIITSEYDFEDIAIIEAAYSRYGDLPANLVDVTIDYYHRKTELRGVESMEYEYNKSKNQLNSVYGMMAQDPLKNSILFAKDPETGIKTYIDDLSKSREEILHDSNEKAFLSYAWGVWVTSWARLRLEDGLRLAGENAVYCDTDSVKYIGDVDWEPYNQQRMRDSVNTGAYATDPKGVTHYMGVYEMEKGYDRFRTLGAKKYAYVQDGKLGITIAGVSKKKGAAELGSLDRFRPGTVFNEAGGTESVYNDRDTYGKILIDNHELEITRNVAIIPSSYTLGISGTYESLTNDIHRLVRYILDDHAYICYYEDESD